MSAIPFYRRLKLIAASDLDTRIESTAKVRAEVAQILSDCDIEGATEALYALPTDTTDARRWWASFALWWAEVPRLLRDYIANAEVIEV